jgi:hypothetical protein
MQKGIQYSHYCGTELLEIINGIHLCIEYINEDNKKDAVNWGNYTKQIAEQLRDKIAQLDKINGMEY